MTLYKRFSGRRLRAQDGLTNDDQCLHMFAATFN